MKAQQMAIGRPKSIEVSIHVWPTNVNRPRACCRKHRLPDCPAISSSCSWLTVYLAVNAEQRGNPGTYSPMLSAGNCPALNAHRRPRVADSPELCRRLSLLSRMCLQLPVTINDCACCIRMRSIAGRHLEFGDADAFSAGYCCNCVDCWLLLCAVPKSWAS